MYLYGVQCRSQPRHPLLHLLPLSPVKRVCMYVLDSKVIFAITRMLAVTRLRNNRRPRQSGMTTYQATAHNVVKLRISNGG